MFFALNELGRGLDIFKMCALSLVERGEVAVIIFDNKGLKSIERLTLGTSKKSYWMTAPPSTRKPNHPDYVSPGHGSIGYFLAGISSKNYAKKQERALELINDASYNLKLDELEDLVILIGNLQNANSKDNIKCHKMLKLAFADLSEDKRSEIRVFFKHGARKQIEPMFCYGIKDDEDASIDVLAKPSATPEAAWWCQPEQHKSRMYKAIAEDGLKGTCIVTLKPDVIPELHLGIPAMIAKTPVGLCTRNKSWATDVNYDQSQSSRIGLDAMVRSMKSLEMLIRNGFKDVSTAHKERQRAPTATEDTAVIHHVTWTENMSREFGKIMESLFEDNKADESPTDETRHAQEYIHSLSDKMWRKSYNRYQTLMDAVPKDQKAYYLQVVERQSKARVDSFEEVPIRQAVGYITQWFNDLSIAKWFGSGEYVDWFTFYKLREAMLDGGNSSAVSYNPLCKAALHGSNLPPHYVKRLCDKFFKSMIRDGEAATKHKLLPLAVMKLFLIRQGIPIDKEGYPKVARSAFILGNVYGRFQNQYEYVCRKRGFSSKNYHSKFLRRFMFDPLGSFPSLWRDFYVYNGKLDRLEASFRINILKQPFKLLSPTGFDCLSNLTDQCLFWMGWHASHFNKSWSEKFKDVKPICGPNLLGKILANCYRTYLDYCDMQDNPDRFMGQFINPFLLSPRKSFPTLERRHKIYAKKVGYSPNLGVGFLDLPFALSPKERGFVVYSLLSSLQLKKNDGHEN